MAAADKRASLLSDLLAAKGGATGGDAAKPAEPEPASVISIAKRRMGEERPSEAPAAAPGVLYSKGAATASTFRPSYWSFDHDEQAAPKPAPAKAEAAPASAPAPIPVAQVVHPSKSRRLPINFVVAFGCVALFVSTTLFVLSQWHHGEAPAQPQTPVTIAVAPAPLPVAPVAPPTQTLAETAASVSPPVPAPVAAAPAPPPTAVAPAPTPAISAPPPVASEPPPPAPAEPASKAPAETAAASTAAPPAPAVDTRQADALLARGDDLLATGDVAAARLFYQRAAELGSASAATAVGQTYDPGVLQLLRVRGARGDTQMAAEWYRKAIAAGDRQAEIRLKRLLARGGG
ncbi:MAG TPA: hypothetical protein VJN67_24145 [Stellaceae bacterium]|nr:hypothetical protein [Stellaceae bacterium]